MGIGAGNGPGGAREGAGRPPGSESKRSRDIALKLAMDGGETPFSVMLKTMRALWLIASPDGTNVTDIEAAKEASAVAKDAAPYVHPKLNAIALENGSDEPFVIKFDREDANA